MQNITFFNCIYVPAKDVYQAVQWYEKILGCTLDKGDKLEPGITGAVLRFPDPNGEPYAAETPTVPALFLIQSLEDSGNYGFRTDDGNQHAVGSFITPNIQKMYDHMRENGVVIRYVSPENDPNAPNTFEFLDLDGNVWEIWQP